MAARDRLLRDLDNARAEAAHAHALLSRYETPAAQHAMAALAEALRQLDAGRREVRAAVCPRCGGALDARGVCATSATAPQPRVARGLGGAAAQE